MMFAYLRDGFQSSLLIASLSPCSVLAPLESLRPVNPGSCHRHRTRTCRIPARPNSPLAMQAWDDDGFSTAGSHDAAPIVQGAQFAQLILSSRGQSFRDGSSDWGMKLQAEERRLELMGSGGLESRRSSMDADTRILRANRQSTHMTTWHRCHIE